MKIVKELIELVKKENEICVEILKRLMIVEDTQLFAEIGFQSLHEFCVKELKYSDGSADRRIKSMQLMRGHKGIKEKIVSGEINITTASNVQRVFKAAKKSNVDMPEEEILESVSGKSTREADKILKEAAVEAGLAEDSDSSEFKAAVKFLLAHFSHAHPGMDKDGLFELLAIQAYRKLDPKRERRKSGPRKEEDPEKREPSAALKREVFVRDENQCTHENANGVRCEATHFLQVDHIVPVALGGLTILINLRLLCATHNRLAAERAGLRRPAPAPEFFH